MLDGEVKISFLNDSFFLKSGNKVMIRRGLFHSTRAISDNGAYIFELETPKIKQDLVRLEDKYGRQSKPYEGNSNYSTKPSDCVFIKDPKKNEVNKYQFAGVNVEVRKINSVSEFSDLKPNHNIMFLRGGIFADKNKESPVVQPGDIIVSSVLSRLVKSFPFLDDVTIIVNVF